MRCHDFDALIEEMLCGGVQPEADEHMRQCERCTSYFRARTAVQTGLRNLAAAPLPGPSRATDRAVMDAYRRRQQQRPAVEPAPRPAAGAQVLNFPGRSTSAGTRSHSWWGGAAAAAAVAVAALSFGVHHSNGVSSAAVSPVAAAPAVVASLQSAAPDTSESRQNPVVKAPAVAAPVLAAPVLAAKLSAPRPAAVAVGAKRARRGIASGRTELASAAVKPAARPAARLAAEPVLASAAVPQSAAGLSSVLHLASTGAEGQEAAPSAGSTWPGYSNLMYCDPVVCSGPMPVVHIKVPVGQGAAGARPGAGSGFVSADVVIGPDGVARAIRVAN